MEDCLSGLLDTVTSFQTYRQLNSINWIFYSSDRAQSVFSSQIISDVWSGVLCVSKACHEIEINYRWKLSDSSEDLHRNLHISNALHQINHQLDVKCRNLSKVNQGLEGSFVAYSNFQRQAESGRQCSRLQLVQLTKQFGRIRPLEIEAHAWHLWLNLKWFESTQIHQVRYCRVWAQIRVLPRLAVDTQTWFGSY